MRRKVPLFKVVNTSEMEEAALEVMRSGRIAHGNYVNLFESRLGELLSQPHLITTSDVSSAIHLALYLSDVRAGDEVLTTAYACMSTNAIIAALGAKAVWIDIKPNSVSIDPDAFEAAITPSTKAALLYHVAGYPGPVKKIREICSRKGVKLIEDCNNALFSKINDRCVGSFGDFAVYSFYPNRQLNTMEGGALVCQTAELAEKARLLRRFGINLKKFRSATGEIDPQLDIPEAGWSYTMSNLSAAVGYAQIETLFTRLEKTSKNASILKERLADFKQINIIPIEKEDNPSYWVLLIQIKDRDRINEFLKQFGIESSILHYRNDRYTCFGESQASLPYTSEFQKTVLALPCGWWLEEEDLNYMVQCFSSAINEYSVPIW